MKILAIDSSATSAGVALVQDEKIIGESYINTRLTHSSTLMPMIVSMMKCTEESISDIDYYAVSVGPGSFTGLRIGVATVKGMAMADNKQCVPVSTLEAIAYNYLGTDAVVCAVMDARCNQFYNAIFKTSGTQVTRLCEDRALSYNDLAEDLLNNYRDTNIVLVGDGGSLAYKLLSPNVRNITVAPSHLLFQKASGVAAVASKLIAHNKTVTPATLIPSYLRLPQAERELKKKLAEKSK
ncbi:MAG TPA: tRNA (adenosine(37)-N6)-threonylcarbamoyltransferase complex dimerization subunit type 1 TsaB [Clostridiales bacterium]|nr:tRNA (adenosine(37)-N6)-threonylcarbamoyltransferase complex dimerization subunit type 1 TsaB [Clostridiales bacterium]